MIRAEVFIATGCHLCPPVVEAARSACAAAGGVELVITDIDGVVELEHAYRAIIPVVEVDGSEIGRYLITEGEIATALRRSGS